MEPINELKDKLETPEEIVNTYNEQFTSKCQFVSNTEKFNHRLLIAIPTTGIVRMEWAAARYGQIIPVNWSASEFAIMFANQLSPIGFNVHDARNVCVQHALENKVEWVLFIDHDTIPPFDAFQKVAKHIDEGKYPVLAGLYYTKANPSEPLIFRGRGNGSYYDWKLGDKVWVDGIPMGFTLIHTSIFEYMWERSKEYQLPNGATTRMVFNTPRDRFQDPETLQYNTQVGTEDLYWCDRVINEEVLKLTGWKTVARKKYPFLMDTSIFCRHIDVNTGQQYPFPF